MLFKMLLFLMVVATVKCANPILPGIVTPFLNQSSEGVYRFKGGNAHNMQFYSYWYQDNAQKRLALGIGERDKDLQAHFWFLENVAYELTPKNSKDQSEGYKCERFIDFNYTMEVAGYDERYLQPMGVYNVKEVNETFEAEFFLGVALDGVGPLNVIALIDQSDGTYAKMYTLQAIGFAAYSEYYLYPRNDSLPAERHFELAAECKRDDVHEVRFFETFDMNGKRRTAGCPSNDASNISIPSMFFIAVLLLVSLIQY